MKNKLFLMFSIFSLLFSGCERRTADLGWNEPGSNQNTNLYFTVTFDSNGGTPVESQKVKNGEKATKPFAPYLDSYDFCFWALNNQEFDFETAITSNITLVANWTLSPKVKYGISPKLNFENGTATYGLYPQTRVSDYGLINQLNSLSEKTENGMYMLDDTYYVKRVCDVYKQSTFFNDGTEIIVGQEYWFKCEPIVWKFFKTGNFYNGGFTEFFMFTEKVIDSHIFNLERNDSTIDGETIYPNNYYYSDIRSWLNNDLFTNMFYLSEIYVHDSSITVGSKIGYDNVVLLSNDDLSSSSYGFTNEEVDLNRDAQYTDFALLNRYGNITGYWTRDPGVETWHATYCRDGRFVRTGEGYLNDLSYEKGVRPSIKIHL